MLLKHVPQALDNPHQATGTFPMTRTGNGTVYECSRIRLVQLNDPIARATQRGIQPEDNLVVRGAGRCSPIQNRSGRAPRSVQARLHLFKLLGGNTHPANTAIAGGGAKAEKYWDLQTGATHVIGMASQLNPLTRRKWFPLALLLKLSLTRGSYACFL